MVIVKKILFIVLTLMTLAACGNNTTENNNATSNGESNNATNSGEQETIVFGQTPWTSTAPPTQIAKQILEEQGYEVEVQSASQPVIWEGMRNKEIDIFMDAWLPYTEAARWEEYKNDLVKVSTSYENASLGWVVPSYVEENSIEDLKQNAEKYGGEVYTIAEGAGIVNISKELMQGENMKEHGFELTTSGEGAMISVVEEAIRNKEPIVFTAWRPHSVFARNDLKFLEGQGEYFQPDNVYVLSYKGIKEEHPEAYNILSNWSISIDDVEQMINKNEENGTSFEELAAEWIENNRDKVNQMIGEQQ